MTEKEKKEYKEALITSFVAQLDSISFQLASHNFHPVAFLEGFLQALRESFPEDLKEQKKPPQTKMTILQ